MDSDQRKACTGEMQSMKIIFLDDNQNGNEYEIEEQDLKQIFQIADTLLDNELDRLETVINKFQNDKDYD